MYKILIIQTASIGDVILASALINSINNIADDTCIDIVVNANTAPVLANNTSINNILSWNKKSNKYKNLFSILSTIRNQKYDVVFNLHRFASSGFLTIFSKAKCKLGFSSNPFSCFFTKSVKHTQLGIHEIERNLSLAKLYFPNLSLVKPYIVPQYVDLNSFNISEKYITISPCSLWKTKELPYLTWANFINRIPENLSVVILGSLKDLEVANFIASNVSRKINILCGKLSLLQSAFIMKNAMMNYSNDSAPTHLASAVNAPIATVFCSTVTDFGFSPLSDNSFIIETCEKLQCRPCGVHGFKSCPKNNFKCGNDISVEQLFKILNI